MKTAGLGALMMSLAVTTTLGPSGGSGASGVEEDLATLAGRRVFFGHQSIGANILDGVRELVASRRARLGVVGLEDVGDFPAGTIAHALVGENGRPDLKLDEFARLLSHAPLSTVDVAMVKFCYADFDSETDPRAVFLRYEESLRRLGEAHPGIAFVHVTVPLTTVQGGPRAFVKRLLGRAPWGLAENARREEYNALLREAYRGREPILDLAEIESTRPDGTRELVEWNGRSLPALVPAYSDDGSHLNPAGRLRVARAFLRVIASARPRPR